MIGFFLAGGCMAALIVFGISRYLEAKNLFYPSAHLDATPAAVGLRYEDVYFPAADGTRVHGWYVPADGARVTIVFAHGNSGNISHRLEKIYALHALHFNALFFDYRGFGLSRGQPNEPGLYRDTAAACRYVRARTPQTVLIAYGESIGGAAVIDAAAEPNGIDAVILEGTFTSIADMAALAYPWLPSCFLQTKFDSLSKIKTVAMPALFIHGIDDAIVPLRLGRKLYAAKPEPKQFLEVHAGHNDSFFIEQERVTAAIAVFAATVNAGK